MLSRPIKTPYYLYDTSLLVRTLDCVRRHCGDICVHYALKANCEPQILKIIADAGFGADCVSGGELKAAVDAGFMPDKIVMAGVGKTDDEINLALATGISCLNVESEAELEVISKLASDAGYTAQVALRINPHVNAHTNAKITTGLAENKFGIDISQTLHAVKRAMELPNIVLTGLHFHIGSQITDMEPIAHMCRTASQLFEDMSRVCDTLCSINLGGGLGIDYDNPIEHPVADFESYFDTIRANLRVKESVKINVELGRSIVGQCGTLVSTVLYIKQGLGRKFAIIDAGMNDLLRPALYGARHAIIAPEHKTTAATEKYDVVGPICESSDVFGTDVELPPLRRGDILQILSAGAYGQTMASHYNLRPLAKAYFTDK